MKSTRVLLFLAACACATPAQALDGDAARVDDVNLPAVMTCDGVYLAFVTMENTGSTTWTTAGEYKLGAVDDTDDLGGPVRVYMEDGVEVPPGGSHTFRFSLRAPGDAGFRVTDWRMVNDNLDWFGDTVSRWVEVSCGAPLDGSDLVGFGLPSALDCGSHFEGFVTKRNTGSSTWESGVFNLGAVGEQDPLAPSTRVSLPPGDVVLPGDERTFPIPLTAPAQPGIYRTDWQMVHEDIGWFGEVAARDVDVTCIPETDDAAVVLHDLPTALACGEAREVVIRVRNTGTSTWPAASVYRLGAVDNSDPLTDPSEWRVFLNTDVPPGGEYLFSLHLTAPLLPGAYATDWQMVREEVGWFGEIASQLVQVSCTVPRDDARIVSAELPGPLSCGQAFRASVTVENVGTSTWSDSDGFKLGAVGESDPMTSETRVLLPQGLQVPQGGIHTFDFLLTAPPQPGSVHTDWRMLREGADWFGEIAERDVPVACDPPQEGSHSLYCDATARDEYGRPLAGRTVQFKAFERGEEEELTLIAETAGATDASGKAFLALRVERPVQELECTLDAGARARGTRAVLRAIDDFPDGTRLTVDALAVPLPDATHVVPRSGGLPLSLYQSGSYDKVIIIGEPFNPQEMVTGLHDREDIWEQTRRFVVPLHEARYDVWLVGPTTTGRNIHEQAAGFAQALQYAAVDYPQLHGADPSYNGKAIVIGISLAGVITRVATSRWEGDPVWRFSLGLQDELPASLIAFIDSPVRGAQVTLDLQQYLWDVCPAPLCVVRKPELINMNSCAFQQLVSISAVGHMGDGSGCTRGPGNTDMTCNSRAFFEDGGTVRFLGGGTCDRTEGTVCSCDAGPAVFDMNGDGFPHGPILIAYSDGQRGEPNTCYGGARDLDRSGNDVCPDAPSRPFQPRPGEVTIKIRINNCPDVDFHHRAEDLVSGSRQSGSSKRFPPSTGFPIVCNRIQAVEQYSDGTFVPSWSALATDDFTGCGPFDDCREAGFSGTHVNPATETFTGFFLPWFERAAGGFPPSRARVEETLTLPPEIRITGKLVAGPSEPVRLEAVSADESFSPVSFFWELGDGTTATGASVEHLYEHPGLYTLRVLARDASSREAAESITVRAGIAINQPPQVSAGGPYRAAASEPISFVASATDADGTIEKTVWSFGDGTFGAGLAPRHAYGARGNYNVSFSATDSSGETSIAQARVSVGTPEAPESLGAVIWPTGLQFLVWRSVPEATEYQLAVAAEREPGVAVFESTYSAGGICRSTGCRVVVPPLPPGVYLWWILPANEAGDGDLAAGPAFTVRKR